MSHFYRSLPLISSMFLASYVHAQQQAITTVTTTTTPSAVTVTATPSTTRHVIVTTVPAPKEVVVTPSGYINCTTVKAGWNNDVWVSQHQVCQYQNSPYGVAWVEGYWACTAYTADGVCSNWQWKAGHWEKTLVNY